MGLSTSGQRYWLGGRAIALLLLVTLTLTLFASGAHAEIRTIEEAPGQVLYQTRVTLQDQHNQRWQAIAFNRHKSDGTEVLGFAVSRLSRSRHNCSCATAQAGRRPGPHPDRAGHLREHLYR